MGLARCLRAIRHRLFYHYRVILLKRDAGTPIISFNARCDVVFCPVSESNIGDSGVFESEKYKDTYSQMLAEGQYGTFGYLDGKCVFRGWAKTVEMLDFQGLHEIKLNKPSVLFHYVFCAVEARGQGIHTAHLRRLCEQFYNLDCYTTVLPTNSSSMVGFLQNGFCKYCDIRVGYFLLFPYHFVRRVAPDKSQHTGRSIP